MNELISKLQNLDCEFSQIARDFGLSQDEIFDILVSKFDFEVADMEFVDYSLAESLPLDMMMKLELLPIKFELNIIHIAMKNPLNIATIAKLRNIYKDKIVKLLISHPTTMDRRLAKLPLYYGLNEIISLIRVQINAKNSNDDSAVLRLIDKILLNAIELNSSDIHIEPTSKTSSVRVRVDGVLCELFEFDKDIYNSLIGRIKLLANLDIAEHNKPQDVCE